MAITGGPDIVSDGLVLSLDGANIKSFRGEPTINHIASIGDAISERTGGEFQQYFNLVPIFETHGLVPYTLSMEMKGNIPGYCLVYMQNGSYTKYSFVSQVVELTTEYQRFVFPNITPSGPTVAWQANTPNDNRAMLVTYTIYGTNRLPTIKNIQLEAKPYATPFVNGTRGTTVATGGGWADLSGNNNHGELVNGPTFNSGNGGSLVFDSTNERVDTNITSFGNNTTWSTWVNRTSSVNAYNMFMGRLLPYFGIMSNDQLIFSNTIGGSQRTLSSTTLSSPNGKWFYLAFTTEFNGSVTTMRVYVNGQLMESGSWSGAQGSHSGVFTIGEGRSTGAWYPFNGKVSNVKIYNRALTPDEVLRNFNQTRSRFGI